MLCGRRSTRSSVCTCLSASNSACNVPSPRWNDPLPLCSQGGGVYVYQATVTFDNCDIYSNQATNVRARFVNLPGHFFHRPAGRPFPYISWSPLVCAASKSHESVEQLPVCYPSPRWSDVYCSARREEASTSSAASSTSTTATSTRTQQQAS